MIRYILIFFVVNVTVAQEFEGMLRYGVTFESSKKDTNANSKLKKYKLKQKKSDSIIVGYVKNGSFLKYKYNNLNSINIYDAKTQLIYTIDKDDRDIMIGNPSYRFSSKKNRAKMEIKDSLFTINNFQCKKVYFDNGYYKTTIYFNDSLKYRGLGNLFFFESLISSEIKNSFIKDYLIVRYTQEFDGVKTIVNLLELKNTKIPLSIFKLPRYKKSSKYDYDENDKYNIFKTVGKKYKFPKLPLILNEK